jgi:hypothetical protein
LRGQKAGAQAELGQRGDQEAERAKHEGRTEDRRLHDPAHRDAVHPGGHHRADEQVEGQVMHPAGQKRPVIGHQRGDRGEAVEAAAHAGEPAEDDQAVDQRQAGRDDPERDRVDPAVAPRPEDEQRPSGHRRRADMREEKLGGHRVSPL